MQSGHTTFATLLPSCDLPARLHRITAIHKSSPVALWDNAVSVICTLHNHTGSSRSSDYSLPTLLWVLRIQTYFCCHILFFAYDIIENYMIVDVAIESISPVEARQ